jgi:hypothetical protein
MKLRAPGESELSRGDEGYRDGLAALGGKPGSHQ